MPIYPLPSQPLWTVLKDHSIVLIIYLLLIHVNFFCAGAQVNQ